MNRPDHNAVHRAIRLAEINWSPKGSPEWERALAEVLSLSDEKRATRLGELLGGSDEKRAALLAERDDKQAALAQIIDRFKLQRHADLLAEVLLLAVEALWHTRFSAQRPFTAHELETQATNIRNALAVMEARAARSPVRVRPMPTTIYQMYGNDALPLPARRLCNGLRAELLRVEQERARVGQATVVGMTCVWLRNRCGRSGSRLGEGGQRFRARVFRARVCGFPGLVGSCTPAWRSSIRP